MGHKDKRKTLIQNSEKKRTESRQNENYIFWIKSRSVIVSQFLDQFTLVLLDFLAHYFSVCLLLRFVAFSSCYLVFCFMLMMDMRSWFLLFSSASLTSPQREFRQSKNCIHVQKATSCFIMVSFVSCVFSYLILLPPSC